VSSREITLRYDESLLRRATLRYWWRQIGIGFILALVILAIILVGWIASGDRSWMVGAVGAIFGMSIVMMFAVYVVTYRRGLRRLNMMDNTEATLVLAESSFTMSTGAASSTTPWSTITEIWQYPGFWLVFFAKHAYFTVPLEDFSAEEKTFFLERVRSAGGKVQASRTITAP
jgi:Na+/melibiose symporter-like transporter